MEVSTIKNQCAHTGNACFGYMYAELSETDIKGK